MKRKNSKKTGIIAAVVGLSAVSLVSVGFASWVISGSDKAVLDGSIEVEDVTENNLTIANKSDLTAANYLKVVYGHPATMNTSGAWLTSNGNSTTQEKLSFNFKVYINNMTASEGFMAAKLEFASTTAQTTYETARDTYKVVGAFPTLTVTRNNTAETEGTYAGKFYYTVSFAFAWGSHFGGNNPYAFYNAHAADDEISTGVTYAADAKTYLQYVETLSTVGYKLTLKTSADSTVTL